MGFKEAPRYPGIDDNGREVLAFILVMSRRACGGGMGCCRIVLVDIAKLKQTPNRTASISEPPAATATASRLAMITRS